MVKPIDDYRGTLEARKAESAGQLLFKAARLFNERAIARIQAVEPRVRLAHTQLLPHVDLEGTRTTELARRVGTSKQAVGQLVDELERMGVVARVPDPTDARARLVVFTERGREALLHGIGVLAGMERELAEQVGAERLDRLRDDLAALIAALERGA